MIGFLIAEIQVLLIGLDAQNTQTNGSILMADFWYVILMTSLVYMTLVLPAGLFYSEDDETEEKTPVSCYSFHSFCEESSLLQHIHQGDYFVGSGLRHTGPDLLLL